MTIKRRAGRGGEIMKVHPDFKRVMDELSRSERTTRVELTRLIAKDESLGKLKRKRFNVGGDDTIFS
jgi:hypothetical protein